MKSVLAYITHNNLTQPFAGSEIVLIDLEPERLETVRTIASKMAQATGVDLTITATTDRRA